MNYPQKVMLVGWDAADWKMIHPLMDAGHMPNLNALVNRGVSGNLSTLSPILSPMLWSSIATGKRPYKHGVHGFTEPTPDGKSVRPVTSMTRKTHAIWNMLTLKGKTSQVVGWWPSNPAEPINGAMVSNLYQRAPKNPGDDWPMLPGTIHPARLEETLKELRFHPSELTPEDLAMFLPNGHLIDQTKDRRVDAVARIVSDCTTIQSAATHLLSQEPWDFAAIYFDAIDHFGHGFMKYHPPKQDIVSQDDFNRYNQVISAGYVYHDQMLGRLIELAGEDTTVMLISDHGFHPDQLRPQSLPMEPAGPALEHRDQGIIVMAGPGIKRDARIDSANLLDICPTILTLMGLPVGEDMDGRPLLTAFKTVPEVRTIPSWDDVKGDAGRAVEELEIDPDMARENMEQLIALGYIDRPSDNSDKAVAHAKREQSYNLALSYMDANMHPKAAELLTALYQKYPLEFRFGLRLSLCLQTMQQHDAMAAVIEHLNENWRQASEEAKARIEVFAETLKDRRASRDAKTANAEAEIAKAMDEAVQEVDDDAPETGDKSQPLIEPGEAEVLRRLRGIARGNPMTLEFLSANIAISRNQNALALKHLEKVRSEGVSSPNFHLQIGNACLAMRDHTKAREAFQAALSLDAENPLAYLGLCRVELRERNPEAARGHIRSALGLKYALAAAHYYHAIALHRLEKPLEAIAAAELALSQNPNFPQAHILLSVIHGRILDDKDKMVFHRQEARELRRARQTITTAAQTPILPKFDTIDLETDLPNWPKAPTLDPMLLLNPVDGVEKATKPTFIVSGLPRSGTSMAMQMLVAGGLPVLADDTREADENNPLGYLEYQPVMGLQKDNTWLELAQGRVLKVVAPLLPMLPQGPNYRIILMEREIDEIITSQTRMLSRLDKTGAQVEDADMANMYAEHIRIAKVILDGHDVPYLSLEHRDVISDPARAAQDISEFLDLDLNIAEMAQQVDPTLWRERA